MIFDFSVVSLYHSSTDIMAMERPIALTSSDIAALDINPGTRQIN